MNELSVTEIAVILAALAYLADRVMDARGWSRSSKTLRRENEDLVRRNEELEKDVVRLNAKVASLEAAVDDLRRTDQKAVLEALQAHEAGAKARHMENQRLLTRAVQALEGGTPA